MRTFGFLTTGTRVIPNEASSAMTQMPLTPALLSHEPWAAWRLTTKSAPRSYMSRWAEDTGAVQAPGTADAEGVQQVQVTLSPALVAEETLYVKLRASE